MNMVEKVAKAMASAESGPEGSSLFSVHWDEFGDGYMDSARVAIEAMREPSRQVLKAGKNASILDQVYLTAEEADAIWREMISAALTEEKPE